MANKISHTVVVVDGTKADPITQWNADHTISEPDLRKDIYSDPTLMTGLMRAWPLNMILGTGTLTYDGTWLKMVSVVGEYPMVGGSGVSVQNLSKLEIHATVKATPTTSYIFYLFMEPYKGDFANYQGLDTQAGTTYYARSCNAAVVTATNLGAEDWSVETKLRVVHEYDRTHVFFYRNGVLIATHTTNISAQPYECNCLETDAQARTVYLKYPPGLSITSAGGDE
jgi:sulfur transfer complex TusBCD TusB component (DsrH family)